MVKIKVNDTDVLKKWMLFLFLCFHKSLHQSQSKNVIMVTYNILWPVNKLHMDINSFCTARHFCEMRIFSYYFPLKFLSFFCTSHFTSSDKRDSKFCVSAFHAASVIECWYKIYVMLSLRLALDLVRAVSFTSTCICRVRYRVTDILSRLANHITCCLYDPVLILFLMTSFLIVFLSLIWLFSCILLP